MLAKTLKALLLLCLIQAARTVADPVRAAPRLVGTASPFRRTEARAQRTLNASPETASAGEWGSSAPRSRALGGKSGMTRAEPLVLLCGFQGKGSLGRRRRRCDRDRYPNGPRRTRVVGLVR